MAGSLSYSASLRFSLALLALSFAGPAAALSPAGVAEDFLNKIESGNTVEAFGMLTASAKRGRSAADMKAPPRQPDLIRRVAFQGPIDPNEAGQQDPGKYFIVCMIDVPQGSGAVTNIAVTVAADPDSSQLRIADYRYDSHPAPACASRM